MSKPDSSSSPRLPWVGVATFLSACGALVVVASVARAGDGGASAPVTVTAVAMAQVPEVATDAGDVPRACGLGAAFHADRRARLKQELRAQTENGLVLVRGLPPTRDYVRFRQDKTFWYLTGVESPNAALLLDLATGRETLFLPARNARLERWEGEVWDCEDEWVKPLTGFADVRSTDELVPALKAAVRPETVVWISKEPWVTLSGCWDRAAPYDRAIERDPLDGRASRESALEENLRELLGVDVRDCAPVLSEMRRVKRPEEIAALRRAGQVGARAMAEAIRSTRPGVGEWELEAVMDFVHRREGATGPAYHGIVGCGPNALILHYSEDSRRARAGEMLLLDYAPEVDHYVSDITRSWPVDGQFTPRMIELYDAVLEAQEAGIAAVKPGATFEEVEKACRSALSKRGLMKLTRHGACHFVGLEVHDVGDYRRPLEPGVVLTVEPGLYDSEARIGIRIEDVVLVTETGREVLTRDVPKDRASMTRLVAEEGWLDRHPVEFLLESPVRPAATPTSVGGK